MILPINKRKVEIIEVADKLNEVILQLNRLELYLMNEEKEQDEE